MCFDIESIEKIIVHKLIYSSDKKKFEPDYSDRLIENLSEITPKIKCKIKKLLSKKIAMDIRTDGIIFGMVKEIHEKTDKEFIDESKEAAKKLADDPKSSALKKMSC